LFGATSDFFIHIGEGKKWYCTLVGLQVIFLIHISEKQMLLQEMILCSHGPMIGFFNSHDEKKMILYMCGFTNGLFYSHKKMILHTYKPTIGFGDSHKENKMILHICKVTNGF
jgi:hypothetical protein